MVVSFADFVSRRSAHLARIEADREYEILRRTHLERVLTDLLAELQAA